MLKIPTEFPNPGSEAMYRPAGRTEKVKVRIVSYDDAGRPLVLGRNVSCRVDMAELTPYAEPRAAIDLWADKRVASVLHPARTSAGDAWADFKAWYDRVFQATAPMDFALFKDQLKARGFVLFRSRGLFFAFTLAPADRAAA